MNKEKQIYEILGISEERANEILKEVENLMFLTSYDTTEIPLKILEKFNDPKEVFIATMVYVRIHDVVINNKVYKG